jgi:hypothetical protein
MHASPAILTASAVMAQHISTSPPSLYLTSISSSLHTASFISMEPSCYRDSHSSNENSFCSSELIASTPHSPEESSLSHFLSRFLSVVLFSRSLESTRSQQHLHTHFTVTKLSVSRTFTKLRRWPTTILRCSCYLQ